MNEHRHEFLVLMCRVLKVAIGSGQPSHVYSVVSVE
jgi:hypothetical protein